MKQLIIAFTILIGISSFAQNSIQEKNNVQSGISDCVDTKPDFPGGLNLFRKLIVENFRMRKVAVSGNETCEITYIVERDGTLSNIKAVGSNASFNEEAVRAVSKIKQKWIPATVCNQKVRFRFRVPLNITFN